ncbi:MAG: OmpA family protein [Paracoccus sp. (in: a-proteobacteria)]|uniref:OmpA family protein n=1 Tax=Paracoccus sp. TaxID=267 RepID=UPI00391D91B7
MIRAALFNLVLLATLSFGGTAQALDCRFCEGKPLPDLLELSVSMNSAALRAQIRAWIAEKYPETAAGHVARAWVLDGRQGPLEDVAALYREGIRRDPGLGLGYTNLAHVLERMEKMDEAAELYLQGAAVWPQHPFFVQYAYYTVKNTKGRDAAQQMLRQAEQDGLSEDWTFDYVRGVVARDDGDLTRADQYFTQALARSDHHDALTGWLDNRLQLLAGQRASRDARIAVILEAIGWARNARSEPALRHAAMVLSNDFDLNRDAHNLMVEAYDIAPTPEAVEGAFGTIGNDDFAAGLAILERGLRDLPDNFRVLTTAVWAYRDFQLDPQKAEDFGQRAIANAPTQTELDTAIQVYSGFTMEAALHDRAVPVFERHLTETTGDSQRNILGHYLDNRVHAGDFAQASRLLERAARMGGFSDTWLAARANRISNALRLSGQRDQFYAENPFLQDWEVRFGDSLRVTVEFATGKAEIQPGGFGVLDGAAQALNAPGADNYVFLIEGHTDSTGTDAVNLPLSHARADAIREHFIRRAAIAPERLQTVGHGPRIPLATNATESGKQTNRRVEIRPYGNITAPRIATSGWLQAEGLALTPDGRYAVTGHTPAQVWDLERMVRVHQLPVGGTGRQISPNGRYIAVKSSFLGVTGVTDNALLIYDLRTGLLHSQLPNTSRLDELAWSPFSDAVAYTDVNGFVRIYDLSTRRIRAVAKMGTIRGSEGLAWTADGAHIVTKAPRTNDAIVRDANSLQPLQTLSNAGWVHSMVSTFDGAYLVAMNNSYELVVWRSSDWAEVARHRMPAMTFGLVAHPTQQQVMIVDAFTNAMRLALVDVPSGEVLASLTRPDGDRDTLLNGGFTPDGASFVTVLEDQIAYLDTRNLQVDRRLSGNAREGLGLTMVPSQDLVMTRDAAGTDVWNVTTGRRVHRIDGEVAFAWQPLSPDGTVLFTFDKQGQMHRFDAASFRSETVLQLDGEPYSMSENATHIALGSIPSGNGPFTSPGATIHVIEKATLRTVMRKSFDLVSEPTTFPDIYAPRVHVKLADNGMVAVTSSWVAGFRNGRTEGRVVTIYDPDQDREVTSFQTENRYFDMEWTEGGTHLKFRGRGLWSLHDPANGRVTGTETPDPAYRIALQDGRTLEWFWDHVMLDGREISFPYNLRHLEVNEARNLAIGLTTGNELVFIDLNTMQQALTIAAHANEEWIAFTPDGRYTASLNGTGSVYWSLGDNYLPFAALSEQYERPGLIRDLLDAIARGADLPRDGPNVEADVFDAPYKVRLVSDAQVRTTDDTFMLELEVQKDSADLADPEIEYTLNGRRVLKSRGFEEEAVFDSLEILGLKRRFDLAPGPNVIEASLVWRDARIQTQTIRILREGGQTRDEQPAGRTLWFFGVGVSDYERPSQNLNFAHKDAIELARLMAAQQGRLFRRVESMVLTDAEATERNVRVQMNEFLGQAGKDDVIVLFLAGHGVVDEEQQLYFMTHEGDLQRPYTGMSVDRFRSFLENRPLNQNALLLLDICHSGAGDTRVVADDAVQSLTRGTGAVVFASSSGSELSFEDDSFGGGHGAFTAALLEGLGGLADTRVGNRDGFNSLQEIVLFTSSRVPELTEGRQRPQIPQLALSVDYRLSVAPN